MASAKDLAIRGAVFQYLEKEHPIAAIGIAFGIGYITVRLLKK